MTADNLTAHGFAKGRTQGATHGTGSWRTPPDVLDDLRQIVGRGAWAYDLAATRESSVAGPEDYRWAGPGHPERPDALAPGVHPPGASRSAADVLGLAIARVGCARHDTVWCNPPYDLWPAFGRVLVEAASTRRVWSVLFVFARTDTAAWHEIAPLAVARAYRCGRVRFLRPDGTRGKSAPAPSVALVFGPERLRTTRGAVTTSGGRRWHVELS